MQVNAAAAFAEFRIGQRPLACLLDIPFKGLVAVFIRNIKVDYDMVFRKLDVMELGGVQIMQLGLDC